MPQPRVGMKIERDRNKKRSYSVSVFSGVLWRFQCASCQVPHWQRLYWFLASPLQVLRRRKHGRSRPGGRISKWLGRSIATARPTDTPPMIGRDRAGDGGRMTIAAMTIIIAGGDPIGSHIGQATRTASMTPGGRPAGGTIGAHTAHALGIGAPTDSVRLLGSSEPALETGSALKSKPYPAGGRLLGRRIIPIRSFRAASR
jgi:hypothetical protein